MQFHKPYLSIAWDTWGFKEPTPVQTEIIPILRKHQDVVCTAKTGSGKTHSYLIPIMEMMDEAINEVQAVIISPTADLSEQIFKFFKMASAHSPLPIDIRLFIGQTDKEEAIQRLNVKQPQIVIGTPGRLHDLIVKENILKAHTAKILIVDEADMAMDSGFLTDIDQIAITLPKQVQIAVFSATIPVGMRPFLKKYLHQPLMVDLNPVDDHNLLIKHTFIRTKEQDKMVVFEKLLKVIQPYLAICFANTIAQVEMIYGWMLQHKMNAVMFHGDIPYRTRKQILSRIHHLDYQYIVATDILSRGIDIPNISHIINYDLPKDSSFYIHRSGRTGRIGQDGMAISLYDLEDHRYIDELEKRGIRCVYREIISGELRDARPRQERSKRSLQLSETERQIRGKHPLPTKVKPGYKVKHAQKIKKAKRTQQRRGKSA
ncbi:MAG: DEAD/DEAH box helicase [Candidatus Izemoplasmatales bacterium]|jgi:ATP-dependent RNA helicase CshB